MYTAYQSNYLVSKKLVKSGSLGMKYNTANFLKKYELGYWDTVLDFNETKQVAVSGPYQIFRPVYKTSNYEKAKRKLNKLTLSA